MPTVNEYLQDKAILDQTYLDRYGNQLTAKGRQILRKAEVEIRSKIAQMATEAGLSVGSPVTESSEVFGRIREATASLLNKYNRQIAKLATGEFSQLATVNQTNVLSSIEDAIGGDLMGVINGAGFEFTTLSERELYRKVVSQPISFGPGKATFTATEAMQRNLGNNTAALRDVFKSAKVNDLSYQEMINLFKVEAPGVWAARYNALDSTFKTIMSNVSSAARQVTYSQNSDLIYGYEWVSTLDKRTTAICMERDGKIHIYNDADQKKYGDSPQLPGEVYPPAHYRCRSTTVPLTRSWDDLGIEGMEEVSQEQRASMNGQVPASQTYPVWFGKQSAATQREILGPSRYKLYASGEVPELSQYYTTDGRWLTIDELYSKYDIST